MKSAIIYKNLEKLLKKHYGNNKTYFIDVGRNRGRRYHKGGKNFGTIKTLDEKGKPNKDFYGFDVHINKTHTLNEDGKENNHHIIITVRQQNREQEEVHKEKITNLDRLFKLLAHKGELLRTIIGKKLVVERLTEE